VNRSDYKSWCIDNRNKVRDGKVVVCTRIRCVFERHPRWSECACARRKRVAIKQVRWRRMCAETRNSRDSLLYIHQNLMGIQKISAIDFPKFSCRQLLSSSASRFRDPARSTYSPSLSFFRDAPVYKTRGQDPRAKVVLFFRCLLKISLENKPCMRPVLTLAGGKAKKRRYL